MGLLPHHLLQEEAAKYGNAGSRPQVVWPNAILASIAVGFFMQILTPWSKNRTFPSLLEYDGNRQTVEESNKLRTFKSGALTMSIAAAWETHSGEPIEDLLVGLPSKPATSSKHFSCISKSPVRW